jgi:hypothetical protein
VHHPAYPIVQNLLQDSAIGELALDKFGLRGNHRPFRVAQIIKNHDLMTLIDQELGYDSADITRTAGNKYPQDLSPVSGLLRCFLSGWQKLTTTDLATSYNHADS